MTPPPWASMAAVYQYLDREWETAIRTFRDLGGKLPCGPDCSACCDGSGGGFVSLPMAGGEADLLWEALLSLPAGERKGVVERGANRNACPLLNPNGKGCLVYEGRPFWCRIFGLPMFACHEYRAPIGAEHAGWQTRWLDAVNRANQFRVKGPKIGLDRIIDRLRGYADG